MKCACGYFHLLWANGKRLLAERTVPSNLKLSQHTISNAGVVIAACVPNGEIKIGPFALEEQGK